MIFRVCAKSVGNFRWPWQQAWHAPTPRGGRSSYLVKDSMAMARSHHYWPKTRLSYCQAFIDQPIVVTNKVPRPAGSWNTSSHKHSVKPIMKEWCTRLASLIIRLDRMIATARHCLSTETHQPCSNSGRAKVLGTFLVCLQCVRDDYKVLGRGFRKRTALRSILAHKRVRLLYTHFCRTRTVIGEVVTCALLYYRAIPAIGECWQYSNVFAIVLAEVPSPKYLPQVRSSLIAAYNFVGAVLYSKLCLF